MSTQTHKKNIPNRPMVIIGDGAWGKALHTVVRNNHQHVIMWDRVSSLDQFDIVLLTVPTASLSQVLSNPTLNPHAIIINTSKGIEQKTILLPYQMVQKFAPHAHYFTLIGPSFAAEVATQTPTMVNIGYHDDTYAHSVQALFKTSAFHVRLTPDVAVIELFAAFKNVYAIAAGLAHGMGMRANTQAKLLILALEELYEMMRISHLAIQRTSLAGTVGDLVLTTYSEESRNYRFGKALATYCVQDALNRIASTVEGYNTALSVPKIALHYGVKLPLAQLVYDMIQTKNPEKVKELFIRFLHTG
ncbi:MAG TPA: hypothetical protein PKG71_00765 [Candidatus Woesebacteria bacterium]|nr:hypothetical protein [Candidatus Woesebacteria bacterium]